MSDYIGYRAVMAEGARVAFVTCNLCGAAILIDPADKRDAADLHSRWHEQLDPAARNREEEGR